MATPVKVEKLSWDITFNQATIGVAPTHFSVNNGTITSVAPQPPITSGVQESNVWRITANLNNTGVSTPTDARLTFRPTSTIMGAIGPRTGSTDGRENYVGVVPITFTAAITHQTLNIESVNFVSYATDTAIDGQQLSDTDDNTANIPANSQSNRTQTPNLIRYEIVYNIAPPATTALTYDVSCAPDCTVTPTTSGMTHTIDITNITDATGTITLDNGLVGMGLPRTTDVDLRTETNTNFYTRPRVTFETLPIRTTTEGRILLRFSEVPTPDTLQAADITLTVDSNTYTHTTVTPLAANTYTLTQLSGAGQGRAFEIAFPLPSPNTNVEFTLTDVAPFITDSNGVRIFDPTAPLPFTHSESENIDDFTGVATAPFVQSVSLNGATPQQTSGTLTWQVTFDQDVTGVSTGDFRLETNPTNNVINGLTVSAVQDGSNQNIYNVTATIPETGIDVATEVSLALSSTARTIRGSMGITSGTDATIRNLPLSTTDSNHDLTTNPNYEILNDARFISFTPTTTNQQTGMQTFTLTFSRPVAGFNDSHFSVTTTPDPNPNNLATSIDTPNGIAAVPNSSSWIIRTTTTGTALTRIGTAVELTLLNLTGVSPMTRGNVTALPAPPATTATQSFQDTQPPTILTTTRVSGSTERITDTTATPTVAWEVVFNEAVTGFGTEDLTVSGGARIMSVTPESTDANPESTYTVTASLAGLSRLTDTVIALSIRAGNGDIRDTSRTNPADRTRGNLFAGRTGNALILSAPDQNYILNTDSTAPTLSSVSRNANTIEFTRGQGPLVWQVTFSEPVMSVDTIHFVVLDGSGPLSGATIASVTPTTGSPSPPSPSEHLHDHGELLWHGHHGHAGTFKFHGCGHGHRGCQQQRLIWHDGQHSDNRWQL